MNSTTMDWTLTSMKAAVPLNPVASMSLDLFIQIDRLVYWLIITTARHDYVLKEKKEWMKTTEEQSEAEKEQGTGKQRQRYTIQG